MEEGGEEGENHRRHMYWRTMQKYIRICDWIMFLCKYNSSAFSTAASWVTLLGGGSQAISYGASGLIWLQLTYEACASCHNTILPSNFRSAAILLDPKEGKQSRIQVETTLKGGWTRKRRKRKTCKNKKNGGKNKLRRHSYTLIWFSAWWRWRPEATGSLVVRMKNKASAVQQEAKSRALERWNETVSYVTGWGGGGEGC